MCICERVSVFACFVSLVPQFVHSYNGIFYHLAVEDNNVQQNMFEKREREKWQQVFFMSSPRYVLYVRAPSVTIQMPHSMRGFHYSLFSATQLCCSFCLVVA